MATVATLAVVAAGFVFVGGENSDASESPAVVATDAADAAATDPGLRGGGGAEGRGGGFPGGGFGASGEVAAIEGTTVTVEVPSDASGGTTLSTVETDDATEIVEMVEGSIDDLAVGDEVVVVGDESDGLVTATRITEGGGVGGGAGAAPGGGRTPPEGLEPPDGVEPGRGGAPAGGLVAGSISSIDGSVLTVETADGTVTVEADAETTIVLTVARSFDDIEIGDTIQATGETTESDTGESVVSATSIQIGSLGLGRTGFGGGSAPPVDDAATTN